MIPRDMTMSIAGGSCEKTFSSPMTALTNFTTTLSVLSVDVNMTVTVSAIDLTTELCPDGFSKPCEPRTTLSRPVEVKSDVAYASPMTVYWQSSDLSGFPYEYASSIASVINLTWQNFTTTSPPPPTPRAKNSGPSPGAIAGIAVGIGVFLIFSIVLLLYILRRMKQKQQQRLQHPGMSEMEGSSRGLKHFVGGRWRAEQDGTSQPVEAGSTSVKIIPGPPVELDSTPAERSR